MTTRKTAAVIVAAGASMRFGSPKQLARLDGEALLERAVRVAREAGCRPVVVVLGASAELIRAQCLLEDAVVIVHEDWASGMGGSIGCGVRALYDVDGCVVMTCDMPAVTPEHLRLLMTTGETMASAYAGRHGVPAYFPADRFAELAQLHGDSGAREMLRNVQSVELVGGELDIDTPEDLASVAGRTSSAL
ncbi:hypothetical protein GCM10011507_15470 [Edaphobacter acidisoli]|uniref:MobA-like NTP transferase domain-containing protein n=1 Tax=Edaphobacter acidisoli TaxID=2040573 RepID=A0A916RPZ9_9BACT|nr:nucleotidyltransferase family protein [Edaphobacter acidisoli]GGA64729.1 hypothetical protein GCM10011507_15470 [Edaphobacter acidisoli]